MSTVAHVRRVRLPAVVPLVVSLPLLSGGVTGIVGCGGAPSPAPAVIAPVASARPSAAASANGPSSMPPSAVPGHTLARSAVRDVVARGLGAFLQRIELDDQPVRAGGRFRGFRVAQLHDSQFWGGVDLKPGDVITSVNGFPIERPEQALVAFESLEVASELRVAYDRDGQPHEIAYAIADDR
jgi:type II secretory pathway component PulC